MCYCVRYVCHCEVPNKGGYIQQFGAHFAVVSVTIKLTYDSARVLKYCKGRRRLQVSVSHFGYRLSRKSD